MVKGQKQPSKPANESRLTDAVANAILLGMLRMFALLSQREEIQNLFGLKPTSRITEAAPKKTTPKRAPRGLEQPLAVPAAESAATSAATSTAAPAAKPKKPTKTVTGEWMTIADQGPDTVEPLRLNKAARLLTERLALKIASNEKLAETLAAALDPVLDTTMQKAGVPHPGFDATAARLLGEAIECAPAQTTAVYQFLNGLGGMLMTAGWYQTIGESDPAARVKMNSGNVLSLLGLAVGQLPRPVVEVAETLVEELDQIARTAQQARLLKAQSAASAAALAAGAAAGAASPQPAGAPSPQPVPT